MKGSIEKALWEDEQIVYSGHRHWIVFSYPVIWLIVGFVFLTHIVALQKLAVVPLLVALLTGINATINYFVSDFVITNLRMFINVGFIQRVSIKALLINIDSVDVEQGLWGRLLKYGTVKVCDIDEMCLAFERVATPAIFKRHAQVEMYKQLTQLDEQIARYIQEAGEEAGEEGSEKSGG